MKLQYLINSYKSLEELKNHYRCLSKEHHPDLGGNPEIMKVVNNEFEYLFEILKIKANNSNNKQDHTNEYAGEFIDIINKLITKDGLIIEILGSWIWLSGNTFKHKEYIKELGFRWATGRKKWYLGEVTSTKSKNYKKDTWDVLTQKFNYSVIKGKNPIQLT